MKLRPLSGISFARAAPPTRNNTPTHATAHAARDTSSLSNSRTLGLDECICSRDLNHLGGFANRQSCGEHGTVARLKSEFLGSDLEPRGRTRELRTYPGTRLTD